MKKHLFIILCCISLFVLGGCKEEERENIISDKPQIYYLSEDKSQILSEDIEYKEASREENVEMVLKLLREGNYKDSSLPVIPREVNMPDYSISEEDLLTLKFDGTYSELTGIVEILTRAAIVMSLDGISGINYVQFVVNDMPLTNEDGIVIGAMSENSFVDSVTNSINSVYQQEVNLYYASEDGKKLVKKQVKCECDINESLENIILAALINGTKDEDTFVIDTINKDTVINSVVTKETVCYVDFSEDFLDKPEKVSDEAYIYSVVNSLTELTFVNKVKFTIEGETMDKFNDRIEFDVLFERNLELVLQEQ